MDRQECGDRRTAGRQRLEDQRRVEARHAAAAVLLAHIDGGHAERGGFAHDLDGEMLGCVPFDGVRRDPLVGEGLRHVPDGFVVGGEGEHGKQTYVQSASKMW